MINRANIFWAHGVGYVDFPYSPGESYDRAMTSHDARDIGHALGVLGYTVDMEAVPTTNQPAADRPWA